MLTGRCSKEVLREMTVASEIQKEKMFSELGLLGGNVWSYKIVGERLSSGGGKIDITVEAATLDVSAAAGNS